MAGLTSPGLANRATGSVFRGRRLITSLEWTLRHAANEASSLIMANRLLCKKDCLIGVPMNKVE